MMRAVCLALALIASHAWGFDLAALEQQLAHHQRIHGQFSQSRFIPGLAAPLQSHGRFVMDRQQGLLWQLAQPWQLNLRLTAQGLAQQQDGQWLRLNAQHASSHTSRLFLALLRGDRAELDKLFDSQLSGSSAQWQLTLQPKSLLLKQIFTRIEVHGGALLEQIDLHDTSGEHTRLTFSAQHTDQPLSPQEALDLAP